MEIVDKVKVSDIENIKPWKSASFKLPNGLACNTARSIVDYARKTRSFNLSYSCDWKKFIVTITKLS